MAADPDTGFDVPDLQRTVDGVKDDINSRLTGADAYLPYIGQKMRRRVTNAVAIALGGAVWGLHAFVARGMRQFFPHIAPDWGVLAWADILGLTRVQATSAALTVTFTGTPATSLPSGTEVVDANGNAYTTDSTTAIGGGGSVTTAVTASFTGTEGNLDPGATLTLSAAISGIDSTATVATLATAAVDLETIEALRTRVLVRMRRRGATGNQGNAADYETWTREALSTVDKVWIRTPDGGALPGEVDVRFTTTDGPIPSSGERSTVLDYIKGTAGNSYTNGKCPANASPQTPALTAEATTFNLTITPNTSAQQALVEAELDALWDRESEPGGTVYLWEITAAIASSGVTTMTINTINATTPADVTASSINHLTTRSTVTFA